MTPPIGFAAVSASARPLHVVDRMRNPGWRDALPEAARRWVEMQGFNATPGTAIVVPGDDGAPAIALLAIGDALDPFAYAHGPQALPIADWAPAHELPAAERDALLLGWGLGSYRFSRYRAPLREAARLQAELPEEMRDLLAACIRVRDLVNTPTQHMGPDELERTVCEIGEAHGARIHVVSGDDLLDANFPAIHAVGRASHRAPRLISLNWGDAAHPHASIVG